MRRMPVVLAVAAVVATSIIPGAAAPAAAAGSTLTVTTLGREGTKVATTLSVVNVSSGISYAGTSGKAISLPKATYAVLVDVWNTADNTDTLGAKVVAVSGATTTTVDARLGRPLSISLDTSPGAGYSEQFDARLCVNDDMTGVEAYGWPGEFFVIPTTSKYVHMGYMSQWLDADTSTDVYAVSGETTGLPTTPSITVQRSSLATVAVQARTGPASSPQADLTLQPQGPSTGCQTDLFAGEAYSGSTPFSMTAHISPGRWAVRSDTSAVHGDETWDVGNWEKIENATAGASYSQLFYHSSWGPEHYLPYLITEVSPERLIFDPSDMFADPYASGSDGTVMATTSLSLGGKVIASITGANFGDGQNLLDTVVKSKGWYTLKSSATRYYPGITFPSDMLSTKSTVNFHYYLDPAKPVVAPVFLSHFIPTGLSLTNQAAPGSTTTVNLHLDRESQGPDSKLVADTAKTVVAWSSSDNGATWQKLTVKKVGTYWTVAALNPASGYVALRSTVTDAAGNASTVTVYRAYGIN